MRQTHTFVELEVSEEAYLEIYTLLAHAGYHHAFIDGAIDMSGIALTMRGKDGELLSTPVCELGHDNPNLRDPEAELLKDAIRISAEDAERIIERRGLKTLVLNGERPAGLPGVQRDGEAVIDAMRPKAE